jgi:hexosaminidase
VSLGAALAAATPVAARAADPRPLTVPALREWHGAPGVFVPRRDARIVITRRKLRGEARLLAADLSNALGRRVRTTARRGARARPGDLRLRVGSRDPQLGEEGYALHIGRTLTISARASAGLFYGGRTVLQLARASGRIPRGSARDWPRYPERGLMVDNGRKFFTLAWLEARVRELAALKLNLLHLHFSDDQGFRLQSDTHPEIVTPPALSKDDVRALVALARRYHVTIVPELDAPGHLTAALAKHPELQLADAGGRRQPDKLDVTLPAARRFIAELIDEYAPLFGGRWWHTGADEYLGAASSDEQYALYPQLQAYARARYGDQANGKDAVLDFVNWVAGLVRGHGQTLRVWSDGISGGKAVALQRGVAVEWWENRSSPAPQELIAEGHPVLNAGWWPLYYVTGGPLAGFRSTEQDFYEQWTPNHFEGPYTARWFGGPPQYSEVAPGEPGQLGAALSVWNDDPNAMTEQQIAAGIAPRLAILAQKTWGSAPRHADYAGFTRDVEAIGP